MFLKWTLLTFALLGRSAIVMHGGLLVACCWQLLIPQAAAVADDSAVTGDIKRGRMLFAQQCASCHGERGQGVEDVYAEPLGGDYAAAHLLQIIHETMPEGDPDTIVGRDAIDVTAFVFEQFYSERARDAQPPARIELSRLTVPQYRNSVADLVASFREAANPKTAKGGLRGHYYATQKFNQRVIDRTDPVIDFDFGDSVPQLHEDADSKAEPANDGNSNDDGGKDFGKAEEFSIRWEGGLVVPWTGTYEFRLFAKNGVRLWINDPHRALIDGWVRSGKQTEHVESLFLQAGRTYPIRLDFHKRPSDPDAAVRLSWEPPGGTTEPIPARNLRRGTFPQQWVVVTKFPPDDRSAGYERGTRVSQEWDEATTLAAIETAAMVLADLEELANIDPDDCEKKRRDQAQSFCHSWVQRAFSRPLDRDARKRYVDRFFGNDDSLDRAVKSVVIVSLKSPQFLYPTVGLSGDALVANRLAFLLSDSPPTEQLLKMARDGRLRTLPQVTTAAKRLLKTPLAQAKLREFFRYYLRLDSAYELSKDEHAYPDFSPAIAVDLSRSLQDFIESVVGSERSDFRQLLRSDELWVNARLAAFLGLPFPDDTDSFVPVKPAGQPRSGVLTHPYLMAAHAHTIATSPIHRGVFLVRGILGRTLRSPPDAIELVDASQLPDMTTRQRIENQTAPVSCQKCHVLINPLGFALEHYDAVGRYRDREGSHSIDSSGAYRTSSGEVLEFTDARQLGDVLAEHDEVIGTFVERMFEFLTKQPIAAYHDGLADELIQDFRASNYHIRDLVVNIAAQAALNDFTDEN